MRSFAFKSAVAGVALLAVAPFARAQTPTTWTPKHPAEAALPATTINSEFWPILLERLCTKDGKPRQDRPGTCSDDKKAAGQLPADPGNAMRRISTFLDDAVVNSVQVRSEQKKVIPLQKKTLDTLLSQIQPANDATPGTQGTPAQTDAVPSIQPVSQASANAAIAGTRAGARVLASIALNPAGLLTTSTQDPSAQEAGTTATRLADVSLVVPVNPSGSMPAGGVLGSFDFVGVRLRVNATRLLQDALYPVAQKAVLQAMRQATLVEGQTSDKIEPLLAAYEPSGCASSYTGAGTAPAAQCAQQVAAADVLGMRILAATACAEAIASAAPDAIETACGQPLEVFDSARKAEAALHGALTTLRDQYDASYIGLDARYEFGDPTFSMLPQARGSHLLAGLALGHRLLSGGSASARRGFVGIKLRAGYQLTSLNDNMDRASSLDFAVGLETGAINNLQVFKLSVGAEGRHAWSKAPTNADTNFVDIKIGVDIPQTDGTRLGALLSLPAEGEHGATLSLVGNWSALTGALSSN